MTIKVTLTKTHNSCIQNYFQFLFGEFLLSEKLFNLYVPLFASLINENINNNDTIGHFENKIDGIHQTTEKMLKIIKEKNNSLVYFYY